MDVQGWYEVEALMADLANHRHEMMGATEEEVERRMQGRYPNAVAVLAREKERRRQGGEGG